MEELDDISDIIGASDRVVPAPEAGRRNPFTMSAVGALMHPQHRLRVRVQWHPDLRRQLDGWCIIQAPIPRGNGNCWLGMADTRQEAILAGTQIYGGREFYVVCGVATREPSEAPQKWTIENDKAQLGQDEPGQFYKTQEPELIRP